MPFLTIFSAPKPFTDAHIAVIQENAIRSWLVLGADVDVILVGEEDGLAQAAARLGVKHMPDVERNPQGTPLVSSIFEMARAASSAPLLAYVNADILLFPDFVTAARQAADQAARFLMVGQRWDMQVDGLLDFGPEGRENLASRLDETGKLHPPAGSDYFIFPRACFNDMPAFAIGRAGWDNWMIYQARRSGWPVIDATGAVRIIHQNHDYAHLPGGKPHYHLPESDENVRLAGGKRAIFLLRDADRRMQGGRIVRQPASWARFWREAEIFPLVRWHSMALGQAAFALFHPKKAYRELRQAMKMKV
jgi:hypothetical protein